MILHVPRPNRADVLLAAVVTVVTMAGSVAFDAHTSGRFTLSASIPAHHGGLGHPLGLPGYVLVAVTCLALAWRRTLPTAVLLWVFAGVTALGLTGYRIGPEYLPLIVAFWAGIRYGDRRVAYAVLVAGFLLTFIGPALRGQAQMSTTARLALAAWLLVLPAAAEITRIRGNAKRAEAERAAQARQAREEHDLRRAGEERLRIAQDLHDVLAHQLALITVQANAGLALLRSQQPDRAGESLAAIKEAGNSALGELRSALETLRAPGGAPSRSPVPLLSRAADLDQLADGARAAGLQVSIEVRGQQRPPPAPADRAAYRIVQEALTNAVRHAGPGTGVSVTVDYRDAELGVTVANDGRGSPPPTSAGGGNGVPGMRERAEALGGTLTCGPQPGGGYRVTATLPLPGAAAAPPAPAGQHASDEHAPDPHAAAPDASAERT